MFLNIGVQIDSHSNLNNLNQDIMNMKIFKLHKSMTSDHTQDSTIIAKHQLQSSDSSSQSSSRNSKRASNRKRHEEDDEFEEED